MEEFVARTLTVNGKEDRQTVAVRIFRPMVAKTSWECPWQIEWPDRKRTNSGHGVDSVQAVLHAMQMVGSELYTSEEHRSGLLTWKEGYSGYGFPVPARIRDLLLGDDARFL
ncbi:DUF6968 family protein [Rhodopseudomonas palustris]|uniref:DUF6968 family protein n=1 Tax=Rhodopseudomonas palustris TaxID=1076 RepID=UPI0021F27A71|nr:hypothetical protein [Rhodopseudomonas palustris]UYO53721.1 hypothetical protein KQX61_24650 [Rhodopseudomonas palustris]